MDIARRELFAILLLSGLACASVRPTPGVGSMTGYVLDQTGMPLSGVAVVARLHWWEAGRSTYTNQDGGFRLTGLPPGRYRVQASARGLKPVVRSDVPVTAAVAREVQLIMEVRSRDESSLGLDDDRPSPLPSPASGGRGQTFSGDSGATCLGGGRGWSGTGGVSGSVLDQTKSPLMNVTVEIRSKAKGRAWRTLTDQAGFFWILGLKPGRYRVRTSVPGFSAVVQDGVRVRANRSVAVTLILELRFTDENSFVVKQTPGPGITRPNVLESYRAYSRS